MKDLQYVKPGSLDEAAKVLLQAGDDARVLAGGTDLLVALNQGRIRTGVLVDVKAIPQLRDMNWCHQGSLTIGAAVPVHQIYQDPRVRQTYTALALGAQAIGSLQIRHRATLGGNLCNASACMDTGPSLLVLSPVMNIYGPNGPRQLPMNAFFKGYKKFDLAPGELLVSVTIPPVSQGFKSSFEKLKRTKGHDLALVNMAASHCPATGIFKTGVGSCSATPLLLPDIQVASRGAHAVLEELLENARTHICPIDDVRAGAEYRRDMAALFCRRLVNSLLNGQEATVQGGRP